MFLCVCLYRNVQSRESSSESAVINRLEYMKSTDITAWVTAKNVLGSAQSERSFFNTGHISKTCLLYISLNHAQFHQNVLALFEALYSTQCTYNSDDYYE